MEDKQPIEGKAPEKKKRGFHPLRLIENNTVLLVVSFLCAIVMWFAVAGSDSDGRNATLTNVPISVQLSEAAQEAGVRVFSQSASTTAVSITGSAAVIGAVTSEDVSVTASLNPSSSMLTGSSMQEQTLSLRAVKIGNTLADYEVAGVSPSEITVIFDKYKETQLTLESSVQYTAAENYYAAAPTLSTELLTLSGPESSVNRVSRAVVEYAFSEPLTESRSISCKVVLYDVNDEVLDPAELFLKLSDDTVDVSVSVTSRRTVELVPDVRNIPESFSSTRITVDPATIEITGDAETISKYSTLTLSTPIDFTDVTPENNTFTVAIPVPSGATNISQVENATVTFNLNGYSSTTLTTTNISVINRPEGKTASLTTRSLNVTLIGTAAQISRLTADNVLCTVDLSNISNPSGSLEVPVSVTVTNGDSCWATGDYVAHVTVSDVSAAPTDEE